MPENALVGGAVAENHDLWEQLLVLCEKHSVRFEWVRGHDGHPENERCDELATAAARQPGLPADQQYETQSGLNRAPITAPNRSH